jgi:TetR/AcrR family transcriptional regulator, tetracycline repressor protein
VPASSTNANKRKSRSREMLSRERIVDACLELIEQHGVNSLSMRVLGAYLDVDATAMYRHFDDKSDLLRAVGDRIHAEILIDLPTRGSWTTIIREICLRLRASHLARPHLAALVQSGPPLNEHEFALTEALFRQLDRGGLVGSEAALAYHALIELTVASASIDATMASASLADRMRTYKSWRSVYANLDADRYAHSVAVAPHLYATSADDRFAFAIDRLLRGLTK